jgi:hypothetical protein
MQLFAFRAQPRVPWKKYGIKMKRGHAYQTPASHYGSSGSISTFNTIYEVIWCYWYRHNRGIWFSSATIIIMTLHTLHHPPLKCEWPAWTRLHNIHIREAATPSTFNWTQFRAYFESFRSTSIILHTPVNKLLHEDSHSNSCAAVNRLINTEHIILDLCKSGIHFKLINKSYE